MLVSLGASVAHTPDETVTGADAAETLFPDAVTVAVMLLPCSSRLLEMPVKVQVPLVETVVVPTRVGVPPATLR